MNSLPKWLLKWEIKWWPKTFAQYCIYVGSLSCWKIQQRPSFSYLTEAARFHDAIYPNKVPRTFGGKTAPQHHGTSTTATITFRLFLVWAFFFLHQTHLECLLPKFLFNQTIEHVPIAFGKLQMLMFVGKLQEIIISGMPSKQFIGMEVTLMVVLETSWPQEDTFLCNSPTAIIGDFFACCSWGPLHGKFVTVPVAFNFLW